MIVELVAGNGGVLGSASIYSLSTCTGGASRYLIKFMSSEHNFCSVHRLYSNISLDNSGRSID